MSSAPSVGGHLRVVASGDSAGTVEPISDDEIIDAFERGDRRTAELLFDRLDTVINRTLLRILGRREEDHDDLVQACFEQILTTLARGKFARACKLSSWAVSVTTNVALTAIRRRQRDRRCVTIDPGEERLQGRGSGATPEERVMIEALRSALATLGPGTAEVVILHDMVGHDLAEIAVLTGLSVSAAQSRLVRGRAALRSRMDSEFPGVIR
jgi:RNA polymerase sigma-70 factor, ECF subfamily